jgi:hypothetical protein
MGQLGISQPEIWPVHNPVCARVDPEQLKMCLADSALCVVGFLRKMIYKVKDPNFLQAIANTAGFYIANIVSARNSRMLTDR